MVYHADLLEDVDSINKESGDMGIAIGITANVERDPSISVTFTRISNIVRPFKTSIEASAQLLLIDNF